MIDFEHVSKEYKKGGRLALEDINFHVDEGEFEIGRASCRERV